MAMSVRYTALGGQVVKETRGGTVRRYVSDSVASTAALTDVSGDVTDTFAYWPYGETRTRTGSTPTPFGFGGTLGYYTDAAGRLYVRARAYLAGLARWATVDPLWPRRRAYRYVANAPARWADPSGLMVLPLPPGPNTGPGCDPSICGPVGNACVMSLCFTPGPNPQPINSKACEQAASTHYNNCGKPYPRPPSPPGSPPTWTPIPHPPGGGHGGVFPPPLPPLPPISFPPPGPCPPSITTGPPTSPPPPVNSPGDCVKNTIDSGGGLDACVACCHSHFPDPGGDPNSLRSVCWAACQTAGNEQYEHGNPPDHLEPPQAPPTVEYG